MEIKSMSIMKIIKAKEELSHASLLHREFLSNSTCSATAHPRDVLFDWNVLGMTHRRGGQWKLPLLEWY